MTHCDGNFVVTDLKKYIFYYWFSFPALNFPSELTLKAEPRVMKEECSADFCSAFSDGYAKWKEARPAQSAFFGVQGGDSIMRSHPRSPYCCHIVGV